MGAGAWVLDASALLALLFDEPGAEMVEHGLAASSISAVNLSEVMHESLERGVRVDTLHEELEELGVDVVAFDAASAEEAANLGESTKPTGLSLGDRACLALARHLELPAVTADRVWEELGFVPAGVVVIR